MKTKTTLGAHSPCGEKHWYRQQRGEKIYLLRCALADLQGMVEEIDPSGDRVHPAWTTIREIKQLLNRYDMDNTLNTMAQIENFILWYASDEALRDKLLTAAEQYVSEVLPNEEV